MASCLRVVLINNSLVIIINLYSSVSESGHHINTCYKEFYKARHGSYFSIFPALSPKYYIYGYIYTSYLYSLSLKNNLFDSTRGDLSRVFTTAMLARSVRRRKQSHEPCYQDLLDMASCEESYSSENESQEDNDVLIDNEPWIDVSCAGVYIPETPCTHHKEHMDTISIDSDNSWLRDKYLPSVVSTNAIDDIISIDDHDDEIQSTTSASDRRDRHDRFVSSEDDEISAANDTDNFVNRTFGGIHSHSRQLETLATGNRIDIADVDSDAMMVVRPSISQWMDATYNPHIGTLPFDACGERDLLNRFAFRGSTTKKNGHATSGRRHSSTNSIPSTSSSLSECNTGKRSTSAPIMRKRKRSLMNPTEITQTGRKRGGVSNDKVPARRRTSSVKPLYQSSDVVDYQYGPSETDQRERLVVQGSLDDADDIETIELVAQVGWPDMHRAWVEFKQHWQIPDHQEQPLRGNQREMLPVRDFATAMDWRSRVTMSHFEIAWKVYCRYAQHALGEQKTEAEIGRTNYYDHVVLGHAMQCFFLDTSPSSLSSTGTSLASTNQQRFKKGKSIVENGTDVQGPNRLIQHNERPGELLAQKMRQYIFSLL